VAGEFGTFGAQPFFKGGDERRAPLPPRRHTLFRRPAVDLALNVEERVYPSDRLQGDRRDRRSVLAAPRAGGDVGEFEELAPPVAPTQRLNNRSGPAIGLVEPDVAAIGVGLQNADEGF
jgi:hypothetical protein